MYESNYLKHYGILGMKWGVRRYQNKDGSLTEAGKRRYDRDIRENRSKKKDNRIDTSVPDPSRWAKEDIERSKKLADAGSDVVRDVRKIVESGSNRDEKPKRLDLSDKTDDELRRRINRELLENQYNQLFNKVDQQKVSAGRQEVLNVLDAAGDVLAFGSTALGIALLIKQLKG